MNSIGPNGFLVPANIADPSLTNLEDATSFVTENDWVKLLSTTYLNEKICNDKGEVTNESLIRDCNQLTRSLTNQSVQLINELLDQALYDQVTLRELAISLNYHFQAKVDLFGGYAIYVLEHSIKHIVSLLKLNELTTNFHPSYPYADQDVAFEFPILNDSILLEYLRLCKKTNYTIQKYDVSLPSYIQDRFCQLYYFIYQEPFDQNLFHKQQVSTFLHLTITHLDISFTFQKRNELLTINSVVIDLINYKFVSKVDNFIQAIVDIVSKRLRIIEGCEGNPKAFWKILLNQTRGYTNLTSNEVFNLALKSISKILNSELPSPLINILTEFSDKHAQKEQYLFFPLILNFYFSVPPQFRVILEKEKKYLPASSDQNKFYSSLIQSSSLSSYITILQFATFLVSPTQKSIVKITSVKHLENDFLKLDYKPNDNDVPFTIYLPNQPPQIFKKFEELLEIENETTLQTLNAILPLFINEFYPLDTDIKEKERLIKIGLDLFAKEDYKTYELGLKILILCRWKIVFLNEKIVKKIITIIEKTKIGKSVPIENILATISCFDQIPSEHWFRIAIQEYRDVELIFMEFLKENFIHKEITSKFYNSVGRDLEIRFIEFFKYLIERTNIGEKKFIEAINKEHFSNYVYLKIYANFTNRSQNLKNYFAHFFHSKITIDQIEFHDIFCEIVTQLIQQDLTLARSRWQSIQLNNPTLFTSKYKESLEAIQQAVIERIDLELKEEKFDEASAALETTFTQHLWDFPIVCTKFYDLLSKICEGKPSLAENYFSQLKKIYKTLKLYNISDKSNITNCLELLFLINNLKTTTDNYNYAKIDELIVKVIRSYKQNLDKPFLESYLIKKALSKVDFEKLDLKTIEAITSFIFYFKKKPQEVISLALKLKQGNTVAEFLFAILPFVTVDIIPLILNLKISTENEKELALQILVTFLEQVQNEKRVISDIDLLNVLNHFKTLEISSEILKNLFAQLLLSEDGSILKNAFSLLEEIKTVSLESNLIINSLLKVVKIDPVFTLEYISQKELKKFESIFIFIKQNLPLQEFYTHLLATNTIVHFTKITQPTILLDDIFSLIDQDLNLALVLLENKINTFLKNEHLYLLVPILLKFITVTKNTTDKAFSDFFLKKFSVFSKLLKDNKLLKEWILIATVFAKEAYPKNKITYFELLIDCLSIENIYSDSDFLKLLTELSSIISEGVSEKEGLTKHLILCLELLNPHLKTNSKSFSPFYLSICIMLHGLNYTFKEIPEKTFINCHLPILSLEFFIRTRSYKVLTKEKVELLNDIFLKILQKDICVEAAEKLLSFTENETFPFKVINPKSLLIFIEIISKTDLKMSLRFINLTQKINLSLLEKIQAIDLSKKELCSIYLTADSNGIFDVNLPTTMTLLDKFITSGMPIDIYLKILNKVHLLTKNFPDNQDVKKNAIKKLTDFICSFDYFSFSNYLENLLLSSANNYSLFAKEDIQFALQIELKIITFCLQIKSHLKIFEYFSCQLLSRNIGLKEENFHLSLETLINYGLELQLDKKFEKIELLLQLLDLYDSLDFKTFTIDLSLLGFYSDRQVVQKLFKILEKVIKKSDNLKPLSTKKFEEDLFFFLTTYSTQFISSYGSSVEAIELFVTPLSLGVAQDIIYEIEKQKKRSYIADAASIDTLIESYKSILSSSKDLKEGIKKRIFYQAILDIYPLCDNESVFRKKSFELIHYFIQEPINIIDHFFERMELDYSKYLENDSQIKLYTPFTISRQKHSKLSKANKFIVNNISFELSNEPSPLFYEYLQVLVDAFLHLPKCDDKTFFCIKCCFQLLVDKRPSLKLANLLLLFSLSHLCLYQKKPYYEYQNTTYFCKQLISNNKLIVFLPDWLKEVFIYRFEKKAVILDNKIADKIGCEALIHTIQLALQITGNDDFRQTFTITILRDLFTSDVKLNHEFIKYFFDLALSKIRDSFLRFQYNAEKKDQIPLLEVPLDFVCSFSKSSLAKNLVVTYFEYLINLPLDDLEEENQIVFFKGLNIFFINYFETLANHIENGIYEEIIKKFDQICRKMALIATNKKKILAILLVLNNMLNKREKKHKLTSFEKERKELISLFNE